MEFTGSKQGKNVNSLDELLSQGNSDLIHLKQEQPSLESTCLHCRLCTTRSSTTQLREMIIFFIQCTCMYMYRQRLDQRV